MAERSNIPVLSYDWAIQCFLHDMKIDWNHQDCDQRFILNWAAYSDTEDSGCTPPFDENGCYALKSDNGRFEIGDTVYLKISGKGLPKSKAQKIYGRIEGFINDQDPQSEEASVNVEIFERIKEVPSRGNPKPIDFALRSTGKYAIVPLSNLTGRFVLLDKESFENKPYTVYASDIFYLQ